MMCGRRWQLSLRCCKVSRCRRQLGYSCASHTCGSNKSMHVKGRIEPFCSAVVQLSVPSTLCSTIDATVGCPIKSISLQHAPTSLAALLHSPQQTSVILLVVHARARTSSKAPASQRLAVLLGSMWHACCSLPPATTIGLLQVAGQGQVGEQCRVWGCVSQHHHKKADQEHKDVCALSCCWLDCIKQRTYRLLGSTRADRINDQ
jgi:hypothetical protein